MPSAGAIVAAALVGLLYLGGVQVHKAAKPAAKKICHVVTIGYHCKAEPKAKQ